MGRETSSSFSRIADGLKLAQAQMMAVAVASFLPSDNRAVATECQGHGRRSPLTHRASFHGRGQTPLCSLTPLFQTLSQLTFCHLNYETLCNIALICNLALKLSVNEADACVKCLIHSVPSWRVQWQSWHGTPVTFTSWQSS